MPAPSEDVRLLFDEVVDLDVAARTARLDEACEDAPDVRREVERLLAASDRADAVLPGYERLVARARASALATAGPASAAIVAAGPVEPPPVEPLPGPKVAQYHIEARLGSGGMGVVYRARDMRLDRTVALKFLPAALGADVSAKQRFLQEARAVSALDHPNICTLFEIGEDTAGRLFLAMSYCAGETLREKIARGPLPFEAAHRYAVQIAEGLAHAHANGVIHRDVKPGNVLVTPVSGSDLSPGNAATADVVKLVDFGLAKTADASMTAPGLAMGTAAYMSPEQARGEPVDARTDVWSLGVVLYEMLAGRRPFVGEHAPVVLFAVLHAEPEDVRTARPGVPEALARVVDRALTRDRADRYASMDALLADLRAAAPSGPAAVEAAPDGTAPVRLRTGRRGGRRVTLRTAGIVLAVAVVLGALAFLLRLDHEPAGAAPVRIRSLAVLPLENRSGDPSQEYFAEGMTDALIADLGRIAALRVISRTSVLQYRAAPKPVPEIARELNVDAVIEGSVQPEGDRIRITVQLVEAATDRILWTHRYERDLRDVLALQREVALSIARRVEAEVTPQAAAHLAAAPPVDPAAYRLYLWGLHFRNRETAEDFRRAADSLERSVALDPLFAPAHAALSRVYTQLSGEYVDDARAAAEQALALDPDLAGAHVSLGLMREMLDWDWAGAEDAFRQAVRLNPGDAEAHHELGLLLKRRGRFEEALDHVRRAADIDPLSGRYLNGVGAVYLFSRRYDEAVAVLEKSLALDPTNAMTYWRLGQAHLEEGRTADAVAAFEQMTALGGYNPYGHLGHAYAVAGRTADARAVLADIDRRVAGGADPGWAAYNATLVHLALGERAQALASAEAALRARSILCVYLGIVPAFDPLREEPRFRAVLREVGL